MWPALEAFLAAIGAGTLTFLILYGIHFYVSVRQGRFDGNDTPT